MEKQEKQIVEIDILSLLRALWLKKFTIVLGAVLFSLLAFGYSVFIAKKMYQSTTRIYVVSRQNETQASLRTLRKSFCHRRFCLRQLES